MAETTKPTIGQELQILIGRAIESRLNEVANEEFEKAKKRLDERKAEIVAGVVLEVYKVIEMETLRDSLIIKVKLDK